MVSSSGGQDDTQSARLHAPALRGRRKKGAATRALATTWRWVEGRREQVGGVCRTQCQSHAFFFLSFSCSGVHGVDRVLALNAQTGGFADVPARKGGCQRDEDALWEDADVRIHISSYQGGFRVHSGTGEAGGTYCYYVILSGGW